MWRMLQCEQPDDFIIATGESNSLEDFVRESFSAVNLDWRQHTVASEVLFRPTDISEGKGNATKAERLLGWKAKAHMKEVIALMVKAEMEREGRRESDRPIVDPT
jgi:GDPmannose 4,6-dehydratase